MAMDRAQHCAFFFFFFLQYVGTNLRANERISSKREAPRERERQWEARSKTIERKEGNPWGRERKIQGEEKIRAQGRKGAVGIG